MEKIPLWFLFATTGCTCCRSDNRIIGPFNRATDAVAVRDIEAKGTRFASQYSKHGNYDIRVGYAEPISGGRAIIGDRVFTLDPQCSWPDELGHPDEFNSLDLVSVPELSLST